MKSRTRNTWQLARLGRRQSDHQRFMRPWKRSIRGGGYRWEARPTHVGKNHHEPLHEAKQRPAQPRKVAPRPQQAPDMWPDMSILAVAAQAKRKRMVR